MDDIRRMEDETKRQLDEVRGRPEETPGLSARRLSCRGSSLRAPSCGSRNMSASTVGKV